MKSYIIKRLLSVIPVLFIVSVMTFLIIHLIPGDPASVMLGSDATREQVENLRNQLNLDQPLVIQYVDWLINLFRGDLGNSIFLNEPVSHALLSHAEPTFFLAIFAEIVAVIFAIPLGIIAATKKGSLADTGIMGFSMIGVSVPNFLIALLLVLLFGVKFAVLPVAGYVSIFSNNFGTYLSYMVLPVLSLGLFHAALISRMTRSSMIEVLDSNYIKTAKAKGLKKFAIVYKHALKNAFIPILTVMGQTIGAMLAGAVITETVFNLHGIGQLVIESVNRRDYTLIQSSILVITVIHVFVNLIVDLLYGVFDPRVRYSTKK